MPLLEAGIPVADRFVRVDDAAALPDAPALIPLARLRRDAAELAGRNGELGVQVPSTAQPEDIADLLGRVTLIAVEFPKFRDGRGFTIARALRERYGFTGDIRAVGHVLPDQHSQLLRCGFTSVAVPDTSAASRAAFSFSTASRVGTSTLPPMWPHFLTDAS